MTWEEKMAKTAAIHIEREKALEELGISIDKDVSCPRTQKADNRLSEYTPLRNILLWSILTRTL